MAARYGLTSTDVIAELPGVDPQNIGAATQPVSTGDVTQWINDGAAKFNAVLLKSGITPSASMDADALDAVARAVKAYAVWMTLTVMGRTGATVTNARDAWQTAFAQFSNRPQDLGDAYADGTVVNIDSDTNSEDWSFIDNEGSIW